MKCFSTRRSAQLVRVGKREFFRESLFVLAKRTSPQTVRHRSVRWPIILSRNYRRLARHAPTIVWRLTYSFDSTSTRQLSSLINLLHSQNSFVPKSKFVTATHSHLSKKDSTQCDICVKSYSHPVVSAVPCSQLRFLPVPNCGDRQFEFFMTWGVIEALLLL